MVPLDANVCVITGLLSNLKAQCGFDFFSSRRGAAENKHGYTLKDD
jgi:hypothetical protein